MDWQSYKGDQIVSFGLKSNVFSHLDHNYMLSGTLPKEIGKMKSLIDMYVWFPYNCISKITEVEINGTIPNEIAQLDNIESM